MALTGHSGIHTAQSMHSSGSMTSMFGPSRKQSTGQTSTQSVYLQRIHCSVTTWVIAIARGGGGNPLFYLVFGLPIPAARKALRVGAPSANQHGPRGLVRGGV